MQQLIRAKLDIAKVRDEKIILDLVAENGESFSYNTGKKVSSKVKELVNRNETAYVAARLYGAFLETDEEDYTFKVRGKSIIPTERTKQNVEFFASDFYDTVEKERAVALSFVLTMWLK